MFNAKCQILYLSANEELKVEFAKLLIGEKLGNPASPFQAPLRGCALRPGAVPGHRQRHPAAGEGGRHEQDVDAKGNRLQEVQRLGQR